MEIRASQAKDGIKLQFLGSEIPGELEIIFKVGDAESGSLCKVVAACEKTVGSHVSMDDDIKFWTLDTSVL